MLRRRGGAGPSSPPAILSRGSGFIRPDCQPTIGPPSNAPGSLYASWPSDAGSGWKERRHRSRQSSTIPFGRPESPRDPRESSKQLYADCAPSRQAPLFARNERKFLFSSFSFPLPPILSDSLYLCDEVVASGFFSLCFFDPDNATLHTKSYAK